MDIELIFRQQHQLSHAQLQSLEILSMDMTELNQFLKNEYLENPLLEYSEHHDFSSKIELHADLFKPPLDSDSFAEDNSENGEPENFSIQKETDISDYLLSQLDIKLYSDQEWNLFSYLIHCLDKNGFFTISVEEVAEHIHVPVSLIQNSLAILKTLEPYGIFSANLTECLICQLESCNMNNESLTKMIQYHLQDIADGKIGVISRNLHLPTLEVRKNIEIISHLNPKPLSRFSSGITSYIIPDVIFQKENGNWEIILNDSWIENYHLSDYYLQMMNLSSDAELVSYFKKKLEKINLIFHNIEQRRKTLLAISQIILSIQGDFLEKNAPLAPMTMTDVAAQIGIHTSTVSRTINGKYCQYPQGSILLKSLFSAPASTGDAANLTPMAIKQRIKELIATEDKIHPYSDQELVHLLHNQNIQISRRTVAKYREALGIKGSYERHTFK